MPGLLQNRRDAVTTEAAVESTDSAPELEETATSTQRTLPSTSTVSQVKRDLLLMRSHHKIPADIHSQKFSESISRIQPSETKCPTCGGLLRLHRYTTAGKIFDTQTTVTGSLTDTDLHRHSCYYTLSSLQGCRGYGNSHGYGYGIGMGTVMNSHGYCGDSVGIFEADL